MPSSGNDGSAGDACEAEYLAVAFDFRGRAESFVKIVGEFYCGVPIGVVEFANKAHRIKAAVTLRVAIAKIIG